MLILNFYLSSREAILYSRNHKNFNKRFSQIATALGCLPGETVIDGEVIGMLEAQRVFYPLAYCLSGNDPQVRCWWN